jgi:hypothetical protein
MRAICLRGISNVLFSVSSNVFCVSLGCIYLSINIA